MDKKSFIAVILCVFLLAVPWTGNAADSPSDHEALPITIPFTFDNESGTEHDCTVVINYDAGSPEPDEKSKTIKNGETGSFTITAENAGTLRYKISQIAGSDKSISYDNTIYTITIYVTNTGSDNSLSYTLTAESSRTGAKPDSIKFINTAYSGSITDNPTTQDTTATEEASTEGTTAEETSTEASTTEESAAEGTTEETLTDQSDTEESDASPSDSTSKSKKKSSKSTSTGDSTPVEFYATIALIGSILIILLLTEKSKRKN